MANVENCHHSTRLLAQVNIVIIVITMVIIVIIVIVDIFVIIVIIIASDKSPFYNHVNLSDVIAEHPWHKQLAIITVIIIIIVITMIIIIALNKSFRRRCETSLAQRTCMRSSATERALHWQCRLSTYQIWMDDVRA